MTPSNHTTLYSVGGKIAAGKTTFARKLAAEHGAVLICEDEWLVLLEADIRSVEDYALHSRRLRAALGPHVVRLLQFGLSVVLDIPANAVKTRAWHCALSEIAPARHELHWIEAPDELCGCACGLGTDDARRALFRPRARGDVRSGQPLDHAAVGRRGLHRHSACRRRELSRSFL